MEGRGCEGRKGGDKRGGKVWGKKVSGPFCICEKVFDVNTSFVGLPKWLSGKESACQMQET